MSLLDVAIDEVESARISQHQSVFVVAASSAYSHLCLDLYHCACGVDAASAPIFSCAWLPRFLHREGHSFRCTFAHSLEESAFHMYWLAKVFGVTRLKVNARLSFVEACQRTAEGCQKLLALLHLERMVLKISRDRSIETPDMLSRV